MNLIPESPLTFEEEGIPVCGPELLKKDFLGEIQGESKANLKRKQNQNIHEEESREFYKCQITQKDMKSPKKASKKEILQLDHGNFQTEKKPQLGKNDIKNAAHLFGKAVTQDNSIAGLEETEKNFKESVLETITETLMKKEKGQRKLKNVQDIIEFKIKAQKCTVRKFIYSAMIDFLLDEEGFKSCVHKLFQGKKEELIKNRSCILDVWKNPEDHRRGRPKRKN